MTQDMRIQRIEAYRTSDGKVFTVLGCAEDWQVRLNGAEVANRMLESGANLHDCLRCGGLTSSKALELMPELAEVTKDTKLIISHWQCRDEPGYQPRKITPDGDIFVHGHAGSWSGSYGNTCRPHEVRDYWVDTKKRTAK